MLNKRRLIIIVSVVAALLAVIFTSGRLWKFFNESAVQELNFQKGISYRLESHKKDILFINNEEVKSINNAGDEVWSSITGVSNPGVSAKGNYAVIFDLKGTAVQLFKNEKLIKKLNTEKSILCAKVNERGYFAVATEEVGYKGMVTVFSPKGTEIFKWHSGSGYITDIDISSKNKLIVAQVDTSGKELVSRVLHFNIKREKEIECIKKENILISALKFNDDESFNALSDTDLFGFSSKGKEKFSINYNHRTLVYYNIDNKHNLVLAFKGNVNNTIIESYSASGKKRGSFDAQGEVGALDVNGEIILLSVQRKLYSVTPSGKVRFKREMKNEISTIKIFSNRRKAVLIGGNNVMLYDIN